MTLTNEQFAMVFLAIMLGIFGATLLGLYIFNRDTFYRLVFGG